LARWIRLTRLPTVLLLTLALIAPACGGAPRLTAQARVTLVVHDRVVGQSPVFVGANPGLTTAPNWEAWLRDSRMNAAHEWANMEEIEPRDEDGDYGDSVTDEVGFQAARAAVLAAPDRNRYLAWSGLHFEQVDRRLGAYDRLGITPIVVVRHNGSNSTRELNQPAWMANVPTSWADLWEFWKFTFAVAYHTAREHGARRFMILSEPDRSVQGFGGRVEDYERLLRYGADAARMAVRIANPALDPTIFGPGLADPTARRGSYLQTVLRDRPGDVDVLDYHQYGPASTGEFAARAQAVRDLAAQVGAPRPLFVSEYNVSRSGERGDVDNPDDALELVEAQRQLVLSGVEGMLVYRFNYPAEFRNLSLIRSSPGSGRALVEETFGYQVFKQFAAAAAGRKELLEVEPDGPAGLRQAQAGLWLAARDVEHIFLLGLNRGPDALSAEIDVAALRLEGRAGIARAASASRHNEIIARPAVSGGRLSLVQPPASALLVTFDQASGIGAPVALRIEPPDGQVAPNRVLQLSAVATSSDGSERDVTDQVSWTSSDPVSVRVNSTGLAIGLAPAAAEITASWGEVRSEAAALVVRP
jgi:hypothetical protein